MISTHIKEKGTEDCKSHVITLIYLTAEMFFFSRVFSYFIILFSCINLTRVIYLFRVKLRVICVIKYLRKVCVHVAVLLVLCPEQGPITVRHC